jgi:HEAT repeat protein
MERTAMIGAVGNAGLPSVVVALAPFAKDEDPGVREAVARAMRRPQTPEARDVLFGLASDPSPPVERGAVAALGYHKLSRQDLERLARMVAVGETSPAVDPDLVSLLAYCVEEPEPVRRILHVLATRAQGDPAQAARIAMVLRTIDARAETAADR